MKTIDRKALDLAIAKLDKEFGANTVIYGDVLPSDVEVISSGNFKLDLALGVGGFPKGRICELFGGEALGKSLISLKTVAECQAAGGLAAYIDVECDVDPDWATTLGVNLKDLVIAQPEYGEQAFQILHDLVQTNCFDLIVVDSVAAMTPKAELDGTMEDQHIGLQARMMAHGLRKTRNLISDTGTCVIFVNQIRDKIGFMSNGGTTSPGGRALKFYASVRIELKRMGNITDKKTNESVGTRVKALVLKNKVGNPMKSVEYDVVHGIGINNYASVLEMAIQYGLIVRAGAYYYKTDETGAKLEKSFAQGEANAVEMIASDLDWYNQLKVDIKASLK